MYFSDNCLFNYNVIVHILLFDSVSNSFIFSTYKSLSFILYFFFTLSIIKVYSVINFIILFGKNFLRAICGIDEFFINSQSPDKS